MENNNNKQHFILWFSFVNIVPFRNLRDSNVFPEGKFPTTGQLNVKIRLVKYYNRETILLHVIAIYIWLN